MTLASPDPTAPAEYEPWCRPLFPRSPASPANRTYRVEANTCRLTAGTLPFLVVCPDDGWSLPCRTWQAAMRHAATLNTMDAAPAAIAVSPTLAA